MTTQQAETLVERQARAFEHAKPSFVERWNAGEGEKARKPKPKRKKAAAKGDTKRSAKSGTKATRQPKKAAKT